MAFGIQILNSAGSVQISDGVPNYGLREVVVAANFLTVGPYSDETVVAFAPTTFASQFFTAQFNNKAYVFSPCSEFSPASSGYGMEVYDASGDLCFTSLRLPLIIVQYVELDSGVDTSEVYTLTSGRKYAVIPLVENINQTDSSSVISTSAATSSSAEWTYSFKVVDHVVTFEKKANNVSTIDSAWVGGTEDEGWFPPLLVDLPRTPGASGTIDYGHDPKIVALIVDVTHAE